MCYSLTSECAGENSICAKKDMLGTFLLSLILPDLLAGRLLLCFQIQYKVQPIPTPT